MTLFMKSWKTQTDLCSTGLPRQITTNLVAYNNRNLFCHNSKGQSPKSRCWQSRFILKALRDNPFYASHLSSGGCQQKLSLFGL